MTDLDTRQFKTSQAAAAAGVESGTIRSYFSRDQWHVIGKKAEGKGLPNLFSLREATTFAVAARLIEAAGAHPKVAFDLAVERFSHTGDEDRAPGELYDVREHGDTLLIFWPDSKKAMILPADKINGTVDLLGPPNAPEAAAVIIVLNPIVQRVRAVLGGEG